jgi:hypothetical protein
MGINLRGKNYPCRFRFLDEHEMKTTKWACPTTIQRLGITNDFDLLCNNVGIRDFPFQNVPTYRRLTMEFFSTLEHNIGTHPNRVADENIKFQLMNRYFEMSINEGCNRFGFIYGDGHTRTSNYLLNPQPNAYFSQMSVTDNVPKGGNI